MSEQSSSRMNLDTRTPVQQREERLKKRREREKLKRDYEPAGE